MITRGFVAILLLLTVTPALRAQSTSTYDPCATAPASCATLISTQGSASKRIPNSAVDVTVGIAAENKDLANVQHQLTEHTASLLAYLRQAKVDRLMTNAINVQPQMDYQNNGQHRIVGYTGSNSVSFRCTPEQAPGLLAGVLTNGANSINSTSFTPKEEEVRAARRELSAAAVRAALAQAESMAKAADLHVAAVKSIAMAEQTALSPHPVAFARMSAELKPAAAPIDTAAGDQQISVTVDVVVAATR